MVEVRRLDQGDLALLRDLNRLFAEVFGEPEVYAEHLPADSYCEGILARDEVILLVALDGERVIGGIGAYMLHKFEQARREIFIYDLAVAQNRRREGIATALLRKTQRLAHDLGAWAVFVQADVIPEDEPARALYRKHAVEEITALHFDLPPLTSDSD